MLQQNLLEIGDLLSKTSGAIELEGQRRERHERLSATVDSREKFVIVVEVSSGTGSISASKGGSSISRAFRKRRPTAASTILTNLGGEATLRTLNKNYRVGVRIDGDTHVGAAKELLYSLARESPLSGTHFPRCYLLLTTMVLLSLTHDTPVLSNTPALVFSQKSCLV